MSNLVIDLFSGTESATRPFVECGKHRVECYDILKGRDVLKETFSEPAGFVWASPPCQEYSRLHGDEWAADRTLWLRALEIIQATRPRYWVIENVKMAQWLWGRAPYHYGPYFLWGYYPVPKVTSPWFKSLKGTHLDRKTGRRWTDPGTNAITRAMIPPTLSKAIHDSVCGACS